MHTVTLTLGSMPESKVAKLKLDALVLVDYHNHHTVHALSMCPDPGPVFARTAGNHQWPIFAVAETDVPAERYAVHAGGDALAADGVGEVMSALDGLGAEKVGFYIGLDSPAEFDVYPFVQNIRHWLSSHPHSLKEVCILSATPHTSRGFGPAILPEFPGVRLTSLPQGAAVVGDHEFFYERNGVDSVAIIGVLALGDDGFPPELVIPEELYVDGWVLRVTEVRSSAFEKAYEDESNWRDNVHRIILPRYVVRANPRHIARHFANLDEITTDPENRHLRDREWCRETDGEELDDGIMNAKEFFGED